MSAVSVFDFWCEPEDMQYRIVTRFNEDEILSVEIIDAEFAGVVANYYVAKGYGVVVEDQQ